MYEMFRVVRRNACGFAAQSFATSLIQTSNLDEQKPPHVPNRTA